MNIMVGGEIIKMNHKAMAKSNNPRRPLYLFNYQEIYSNNDGNERSEQGSVNLSVA